MEKSPTRGLKGSLKQFLEFNFIIFTFTLQFQTIRWFICSRELSFNPFHTVGNCSVSSSNWRRACPILPCTNWERWFKMSRNKERRRFEGVNGGLRRWYERGSKLQLRWHFEGTFLTQQLWTNEAVINKTTTNESTPESISKECLKIKQNEAKI